jgi:serine phosphatase RsbU (regulator of sigma subunit)
LTDGLQDQFGGKDCKKLGIQKLKDFLLSVSNKNFSEQKQDLTEFFNAWKGSESQIDDITLLAFKLNDTD